MSSETPVFVVPNELCRRAGIAAKWLPSNKLSIYAYKHVTAGSQDKPSEFAPCESAVIEVQHEVILFNPILRKLVNESNGTFLTIQKIAKKDDGVREQMLKMSRQYRSIIRACLENLQEEATAAARKELKDLLSNYVTIFYSIECVWHLCEILFVDVIPGNVVLPHLLEWVRFHFPKHERNATIMLSEETVGAETNPEYWNTVIGILIQGRIDVACSLLRLHSAADSKPFQLADSTLKSMPTYNVYGGVSVTEFNVRLKHWKIDCQSKIDSKSFLSEKHLDLIMRLTVGEENAWEEAKQQCEVWYELLACWLFFTEPTVKSFEIGQFARLCIGRTCGWNRMRHLDHVLLAAMELDLLKVIKEIQQMSENGWFVSHFTDILYHCGHLESVNTDTSDAGMLRESFLLDYGSTLVGHQSLWQVGLSYLDHCPKSGLAHIELLLPRLPLGSEARTFKILYEAKKRDLSAVESSICSVRAMKSLRQGRVGNALTWAIRSQDSDLATFLADKFLREYSQSGTLQSSDLLDNLGSCMLISDRLIFLGKYCEFHRVYRSGNVKEAATLLVTLVDSRIIPEYFWVTLLTDALPLLEHDEIVLTSSDTYVLLNCLHEHHSAPGLSNKIDIIRLALARNLARALLQEAQAT